MPSKSMRTEPAVASLAESLFGAVFALAPAFFAESAAALSAFSSSLSGADGDGRSLRKTATYTLRVAGWSNEAMLPPNWSPRSVLAVKNRYLPLRSNTGKRTSLVPSVTRCFSPVVTSNTFSTER